MNTKDFNTLVSDQVTAIQGSTSLLIDFTVGSILRAVVQANAAVVIWIQALILQLLATTRAATSKNGDLDTWLNDYGFYRLPAVSATGQVTFARFTNTLQSVIPVGVRIESADGTQAYLVSLDTTNAAYRSSLAGYVVLAGVSNVIVPVLAVTPGAAANAAIGQINTLTQSIPGVDTVTNAAAFTNGADAETDTAARARFILYIASLSKATKGAIAYAIDSLQQNLTYTLTENYSYAGTWQPGYFYVVVDDGTGYPGSTLLGTVSNAIDTVRPFTSTFGVFSPIVTVANVSMSITTAPGFIHSSVVALVSSALSTYINALSIGQPLDYTRLFQVAYDASAGVSNVSGVLLNSTTTDITADNQHVIVAGTITVI